MACTSHQHLHPHIYLLCITTLLTYIVLQARAISAWKLSPRSGAAAAKLPRLDDSERRMLAVARSRRLSEVASKQCLQVIKALMAHKVRASCKHTCADHNPAHAYMLYGQLQQQQQLKPAGSNSAAPLLLSQQPAC
jgi:hypothetical protein